MSWPRLFGGALLVLVLGVATTGCTKKETKHDLYMQGMKIEGEAERGDCKLAYDQKQAAHVLDGDQIQSCLARTDEAIALYDRAAEMGLTDLDFTNTRERALERKKRLETMLKHVREMERPEFKQGLPEPPT